MIYLFSGSDADKTRRKAFEFIDAARRKQPELTYLRLAREELSLVVLEEVAAGNSLFAKRLLVLLDDPFAKVKASEDEEDTEKETSSVVEDSLTLLAESNNAIVILAPGLAASKVKKIGAKAEKTYEFDSARREATRGFNTGLVNALAARNPERLWLEISRALLAGDAPEQIHGLLHWKARSMGDRTLSMRLICLIQNSRRFSLELSESLERFALSL